MKRLILGTSTPRQVVFEQLEKQGQNVIRNITKIMLFPNSRDVPHWKNNIHALIHGVPLMKGSNRRPTQQEILEHLWPKLSPKVPDIVDNVLYEYSSLVPEDVTDKQVRSKCSLYFYKLSEELPIHISERGGLSRIDVCGLLGEVGL